MSNYSKSQLEANPELADEAIADIEIKDQNGQVVFSKTYSKSSYANKANGNAVQSSCFGDCINDVMDNMNWVQRLICLLVGPVCAIGFSLFCAGHCLF